jgi:hypothetical protein
MMLIAAYQAAPGCEVPFEYVWTPSMMASSWNIIISELRVAKKSARRCKISKRSMWSPDALQRTFKGYNQNIQGRERMSSKGIKIRLSRFLDRLQGGEHLAETLIAHQVIDILNAGRREYREGSFTGQQ